MKKFFLTLFCLLFLVSGISHGAILWSEDFDGFDANWSLNDDQDGSDGYCPEDVYAGYNDFPWCSADTQGDAGSPDIEITTVADRVGGTNKRGFRLHIWRDSGGTCCENGITDTSLWTGQTNFYMRWYMRFDFDSQSSYAKIFRLKAGGSQRFIFDWYRTAQCGAGKTCLVLFTSADGFNGRNANDGWNLEDDYTIGEWVCFEAFIDQTNDEWTLWVDGVQQGSAVSFAASNYTITGTMIGGNQVGQGSVDHIIDYDDIVVGTTYIGPIAGGADVTPPATSGWSPGKNDTDVDLDKDIVFHVTDSGDGVDGTTIEVEVEGTTYCCADGSCANKTLGRSGSTADYTITYTHGSWGYEQVINVEIDADDLAGTPNSMTTDIYSFTTEAEPAGDTDPPTPDPAEFAEAWIPYGGWHSVYMRAKDPIDPSIPIEIYFDYDQSDSECGSDGGPGGADSGWQSADTTYSNTGLPPNQCYGFKVYYRDSVPNTGTASAVRAAYSLPDVPGAPTLSNPTDTTLNLMIDDGGNPSSNPTTNFAVRCFITDDGNWDDNYADTSGDPNGDTPVWASKATWDAVVIRGCTPSTEYRFAVNARNQDGESAGQWSEDGIGTTAGDPPPNVKGATGTGLNL